MPDVIIIGLGPAGASAAIYLCRANRRALLVGKEIYSTIQEISRNLVALHVHDNDGIRDLHQIPYEGVIDWADFARALSETCWNGVLSLEAGVSRGQKPAWLLDRQQRSLAQIAASLAGNF